MRAGKLLSIIAALFAPLSALAGDSLPASAPTKKELWERAEEHRGAQRYAEALAAYQEALLLDPSPILLLDIADCYRAQGLYLEARKLYRQYLTEELDSPFQDAVLARLSWLRAAKRGKVELDPRKEEETAMQVYLEGETAFQEERYLTATRSYAAAYLLRPSPLLLFNLAQAYRFAGDSVSAKTYYQIFLKKIPPEPLDPTLLEAGEIARGFLAEQATKFPEISLDTQKPSRLAARTRLIVKQLKQDRRWLWIVVGAVGVSAAVAGVSTLPAPADAKFELP